MHYTELTKGIIQAGLRSSLGATPDATPTTEGAEEDDEVQYEIISSFGMFWRRDAIEWIATPKILGMRQIGAQPVDFHKQIGIYLLYDGREVIYVGRATDRPLGRRLTYGRQAFNSVRSLFVVRGSLSF